MTCRLCQGAGHIASIDKSDDSGIWHQVVRPCRCQTHNTQWAIVAVLALVLGLLPAVLVLVKQ